MARELAGTYSRWSPRLGFLRPNCDSGPRTWLPGSAGPGGEVSYSSQTAQRTQSSFTAATKGIAPATATATTTATTSCNYRDTVENLRGLRGNRTLVLSGLCGLCALCGKIPDVFPPCDVGLTVQALAQVPMIALADWLSGLPGYC